MSLCDGHEPSRCTRAAGAASADFLGPVCDTCAATYAAGGYLRLDTDGQEVPR